MPAFTGSGPGSGPHERFPAERVIADATGGMVPSDGDLLVRRGGRWVFEQGLFYTKAEVDALIAAAVHTAITAHESSEHTLS